MGHYQINAGQLKRPPRPCTVCGQPVYRQARCRTHYKQAEKRRGNSSERGYGSRHERMFRRPVLMRDPICVMQDCDEPSVHADHYPYTRRQLVRMGLDPDDPQYGRGLCTHHHNQWTASQPRT
ncbi:holin [Mycobacterium colombiense]|uniref:Holin n=1 Tax=Mycobacterium colombiense TaxID=339268 RepID=A0A329ME07_9MYCO|nr:holin [Mycobacterium colombiense]